MTPLRETIRQICQSFGLRLNTDLGQHFLVDEDILAKILEVAHIETTDTIVEIGSGMGILTKELAVRAKRVIAIEYDARWIPIARTYVGKDIEFIEGNALQVPLPSEPYKIVANIPYHITSPLLRHAFLESPTHPTSLTLLIQREVAEKICDPDDAGVLTIMVALFGTPRIVVNVPPASFLPPPKVDSAVLHIDCFTKSIASPEEIDRILRLLKMAFAQRRKMLSNTLGKLPEAPDLLTRAGIDPTRRPQTLSIQEWITLARLLP